MRAVAVADSVPDGDLCGGQDPPMPWDDLVRFRRGLYGCLTGWADALFELGDALVCRPGRAESLPALSLEPEFRRGHGSVYAALTAGGVDVERLRMLLLGTVPPGRDGVVWVAGDVSGWPRPAAVTSPQRLAMYDKSARTASGRPVTSGWPFLVLAGLEWGPTSWTAPVDAIRLAPADTLSGVSLAAMRRVLAGLAAAGRGETVGFVFDAEFDLIALSHELAGQAHILGRLRSNQVFHAEPEYIPGARGRRRRHGQRIKLNDPATLTTPDRTAEITSQRYGRVRIAAWDQRHRRLIRGADSYWVNHEGPLPIVTGSVIRVQVEHLPGGGTPDGSLWLWHAGPTPLDLVTIFAVYQRRFDEEHTFRFLKQDLMWTLPAPLQPDTADTWTWLVLTSYTQLRLARPLARDLRLPWQKPADPERISPRRVRRDFRRVHALLGTPANPPQFTRPGPGRPPGSTRPPRQRHPTHRKPNHRTKKDKRSTAKSKTKG
jgi:DDE superfamily endonuclease